jgi:hypothetical protein
MWLTACLGKENRDMRTIDVGDAENSKYEEDSWERYSCGNVSILPVPIGNKLAS